MSPFRRTFLLWFLAVISFFALTNVAGAIRPRGLKPFRSTGFPFTVAVWGTGVEEFFDWSALFENVVVAVAVSGLLAGACAAARSRCTTTKPRQ